jgi:hypothetical protein
MQKQVTLPTLLSDTREKDHSRTKDSSSIGRGVKSPTISGMSVQMRIKIWAEKEQEEVKTAHNKLANRRSLQASALLGIGGNQEDGEIDSEERPEYTAHSDDETIMNKSSAMSDKASARFARENFYDVIDDKVEREQVVEASSSSSETSSPSKSPKKKKKGKKEKCSSKSLKNDSPDQKRKWMDRLKSPLPKRKNKVKKESSKEEVEVESVPDVVSKKSQRGRKDVKKRKAGGGGGMEEEEVVDDVFSPVNLGGKETVQQEVKHENEGNSPVAEDTSRDETGELPSVLDKPSTPPHSHPTKEARSISREIFSIINSLGTINETGMNDSSVIMQTPNLLGSNSEGDSESG